MGSVYLSPSTQEGNLGVGNYGVEEAYCNLVVDQMQPIFDKHGVLYGRNTPDMNLEGIVYNSNLYNPDIHFAIHTNATGLAQNLNIQGNMVLIHRRGGEGERFGNIVYDRISKLTPWADKGVFEGYNWFGPGKPLYELAYTNAPAALVEIDFHDNLQSVNWLLQNVNIIARELAYSVLDYFGIAIKPEIDYAAQVKTLTEQLARIKQGYIDFGSLIK